MADRRILSRWVNKYLFLDLFLCLSLLSLILLLTITIVHKLPFCKSVFFINPIQLHLCLCASQYLRISVSLFTSFSITCSSSVRLSFSAFVFVIFPLSFSPLRHCYSFTPSMPLILCLTFWLFVKFRLFFLLLSLSFLLPLIRCLSVFLSVSLFIYPFK